MPTEAIDRLLALGLFDTPVPLGLFAYEEEPGLQCRLFALVPSGMLEQAAHVDEPWKASVPSYEDRLARGVLWLFCPLACVDVRFSYVSYLFALWRYYCSTRKSVPSELKRFSD